MPSHAVVGNQARLIWQILCQTQSLLFIHKITYVQVIIDNIHGLKLDYSSPQIPETLLYVSSNHESTTIIDLLISMMFLSVSEMYFFKDEPDAQMSKNPST
jgi:hypothetical protein